MIRHAAPHSAFLAALAVAGYVLSQGFSWGVILPGLLSAACLVALGLVSRRLGFVPPEAASPSRKPLSWLRLAAALASVGSLGALVTLVRDEPRGGRIVIHASERSTVVPEALIVQRGLTSHRVVGQASRFTLAGIRCGSWQLRASEGVQPGVWTVSVPASGERHHEATTDFHRRLARIQLQVTDSDAGNPLDARIVLEPAPFAPASPIRTEASGFGEAEIEVGTYAVTVSSEGYEPVELQSFPISHDGQVMAVRLTPAPQPPEPAGATALRPAPRALASASVPRPASAAAQPLLGSEEDLPSPTYDNLLFNAKQDCQQDPQAAIRFIEAQLDNPRFFLPPRDRERAAELLEQIEKGDCP